MGWYGLRPRVGPRAMFPSTQGRWQEGHTAEVQALVNEAPLVSEVCSRTRSGHGTARTSHGLRYIPRAMYHARIARFSA